MNGDTARALCIALFVMATVLAPVLAPLAAYAVNGYEEPAWVYKERGDRLRVQGELGEAIAQYRKALIKKSMDQDGSSYPEVHLELAEVYREQELYDLALRHIRNAENQREFLMIPDLIYRIWYTRAAIYNDMGRMEQVLEVYERIVGHDDNYKEDVNRRFFFNRPLSMLPETYIPEFRQNEELRTKYGYAYYRIGSIRYENGRDEAAEPYLRMAFLYGYDAKTAEYLLDYYGKRGLRAELDLVRRFARQP